MRFSTFLWDVITGLGRGLYYGARNSLGLGPSRRELERECDAMGLYPYTAQNLAKARAAYVEEHKQLTPP